MPKTNTKKPPFIPPAAADDLVISRKQHGRKVSRETCQRVYTATSPARKQHALPEHSRQRPFATLPKSSARTLAAGQVSCRRIGLYGNQQFLPRVSALDGNELFRFLSAEVARQNNGEQTGAEGLKKNLSILLTQPTRIFHQ